jgi:hypothetical protein
VRKHTYVGKHTYAVVIEETEHKEGGNTITFTVAVLETEGVEDASTLPRNRDTVGTLTIHNTDALHSSMGHFIEAAIYNYWVNADNFGGTLLKGEDLW